MVGQPQLKNNLAIFKKDKTDCPTTVLTMEGIQDCIPIYLDWLLQACAKPNIKQGDIMTPDAIALLTEQLATPLQVEHTLTLALEAGYRLNKNPITKEILHTVLTNRYGETTTTTR